MVKWKEEPWRNIHNEEGNLVFPIANQFPIGRHEAKIEITSTFLVAPPTFWNAAILSLT